MANTFDLDEFLGIKSLAGTLNLRLLSVKENDTEIRLSFVGEGYDGVGTEMYSKTSKNHGWVLNKWMKIFNIAKPTKAKSRKDVEMWIVKHLKDAIDESVLCEVTGKADIGDNLYNVVTKISNS
jgi:hypothetical protein